MLLTRTILAVSSGSNHTIELLANGDLFAFRQPTRASSSLKKKRNYRTSPLYRKLHMQSGRRRLHSACVTIDGLVFTWGQGTGGQLGYPVAPHACTKDLCSGHKHSPTPRLVEELSANHKVACGSDFTLALTVEAIY